MRNWRRVTALCATTFASVLMHQPVKAAEDGPVPGTPFIRHIIRDDIGRSITYYVSRPRTTAPILMMIQGSGCASIINGQPGPVYSTLFNLVPFAAEGRFTVVAVEKPFAGETRTNTPGTANSCKPEFNADFTAERWLQALQASLNDARKSPWVDHKRTAVLGVSEGAVMSTMLAAKDAGVTDVIAISGSGTTQLYDFFAQAYRTCFDVSNCLAKVEDTVRAIAADPENPSRFAWGHPFKRWTSFFRVDPGEQLLKSKARVYLAFGTNDHAVPALSQEVAVAKLLAAGRNVTVRRVADADHSLRQTGATNLDDLDDVERAALDWFWQAQ